MHLAQLPETLKIGLLQIHSVQGATDAAVQRNLAEMERLMAAAAGQGAEVLILPEYWPYGFIPGARLHELAEDIATGPFSTFMIAKARQYGVTVCGGTICERGQNGSIHNTTLLIDPRGEIVNVHRKVNLYSALGEDRLYAAGNEFSVVAMPFGNTGVITCYDGDFPETIRLLRLGGAHLILQPAAYESPLENWWQTLYNAYALANSVWIVQNCLVGQYLVDGQDIHCFGMSRVVSPQGEEVARARHFPAGTPAAELESQALVVTLDYRARLESARAVQDCLIIDRRPDLYGRLSQPEKG